MGSDKKFNIVSLFAGAGGMDLGFHGGFTFLGKRFRQLPFTPVFVNDIFNQAADSYEANLGHKVERRSITDLTEEDFPEEVVDVVIGGFPCQPFSFAGKRGGFDDDRGQLYKHMLRVVQHYAPKVFIAENVDGIRSPRKGDDEGTVNALDQILNDFRAAGYKVEYRVLLAADYGVPQMRKRVIIVGVRDDLPADFSALYPTATHSEDGKRGKKWLTAFDAIEDLWGKEDVTDIPNHTGKDISGGKFYPGRKMQGNRRINKDTPSPTIRAEHHGNIEAHYNTTLKDVNDMAGWRRLSVRECARLQSFPDSYNFTASASAAYKMIGNAVPPVMAWHIAERISSFLESLDK